MYSRTTKKISITVKPYYLEDQSEPEDQHFVWAYRVTIDNQGNEKVQLVNRYWKIIDANGILQEVRGKGVVGEQPILFPVKNMNIQVVHHLQLLQDSWKVVMKCKMITVINSMLRYQNFL